MIVIADSSALVALSVCDSLLLLDALFGEVKVPQAVYDLLLIDDARAKRVAYLNNLEVMGSLGDLLLLQE